MNYRGPILIVFAMSLVASPLAISRLQIEKESAPVDVALVQTDGAAAAQCSARRIETSSYAIGCDANEYAERRQRTMSNGGALFVRVNN